MDKHTEIIEEKVEVELNAAGRPKRQCAGAGVERLEMSIDNSKEYAYVKEKKYALAMNSSKHPPLKGISIS